MQENNLKNEQVIKIKESCIKIQENDIKDQLDNVNNENTKSALVIGFIGALATFLSDLKNLNLNIKILLFTFFVLSICIALYNIFSKKVKSHCNIDSYFVNITDKYDGYLNSYHLTLRENYKNISERLKEKTILTGLSYFSVAILVVIILYIKIF